MLNIINFFARDFVAVVVERGGVGCLVLWLLGTVWRVVLFARVQCIIKR